MARFAIFGEAVDAAIADVGAFNVFAGFVVVLDVIEHLGRTPGGIRVVLEVADTLAQLVFHAALVAEVFQQRVLVDDLLRGAKVTLRALCIGAEAVVARWGAYCPGYRFIPIAVIARCGCAVDRVDLHDLSPGAGVGERIIGGVCATVLLQTNN
ncbi:hypothetical protein AZH11_16885 [Pseudomonas simiae]|nr:hypothetical protein AZH11_16885 [Pseudomonas simiae]